MTREDSELGELIQLFSARELAEDSLAGKEFTVQRLAEDAVERQNATTWEKWTQGRFAFVPEKSVFLDCWDSVIIICLATTSTMLPIETALMDNPAWWVDRLNRGLDFLFCADILINFNIAFPREDALTIHAFERTPARIAQHYMAMPFSEKQGEAGWFWLDTITVLPWDRMPYLFKSVKSARFIRVMRLVRMIRLVRVVKLCGRWNSSLGLSYSVLGFLKCLGIVVILLHWLACVWAFAAMPFGEHKEGVNWLQARAAQLDREAEDLTVMEVYNLALYFVTTTLTSVGMGDIRPATEQEVLLVTILMILTGFVWAYIVPSVVDIIMNLDTFTSVYRDTVDELGVMCTTRKIQGPLRWRMTRYMHEANWVFRQRHQNNLVQKLSLGLQGEIAVECGMRQALGKVWYLRDAPRAVFVDLGIKVLPQMFCPGEWITDHAAVRVIRSGICITKARFFMRDDVLGEDMLLETEYLRDCTCPRTLCFTEVATLRREDLIAVCELHTDFAAWIRKAQIRIAIWRGVIYAARQIQVKGSQWEKLWHAFHKQREGGMFEHGVNARVTRRALLKEARALGERMEAVEQRMAKLAALPEWADACLEIVEADPSW